MADETPPKDLNISVAELHSAITSLQERLDKIVRPQCAECSCGPCITQLCYACAQPCIAPCAHSCVVTFCAPCYQHPHPVTFCALPWHGAQLCIPTPCTTPCTPCQPQCSTILCAQCSATPCTPCATTQCARCVCCTPCAQCQ